MRKNIIGFISHEAKRASIEMKQAQYSYQQEIFHTRTDNMNYAYTVGMCTATLEILNRMIDYLCEEED